MSLRSSATRLSHVLSKPLRPSLSSSQKVSHISSIISLSSSRRTIANMASSPRIAIIHQTIQAPVIDGSRKPVKPGGYKDSGADIAFNISRMSDMSVVTPVSSPDPAKDTDWVYPDSAEGILAAIDAGATHIWANTVLFSSHPLQTSPLLAAHAPNLRIIGQAPTMVEKYDNKGAVNAYLRRTLGASSFPRAWALPAAPDAAVSTARDLAPSLPFPIVAKPVRGRGSYGVKVCPFLDALLEHIDTITRQSSAVMLEQFLSGEEATVAVLPPAADGADYLALPVVRRFNHTDGVAPYSGLVAVTANSEPVTGSPDPAYAKIQETCAQIARELGFTAPVRIDVRRVDEAPGSQFAVFDVNTKPNMTAPGRPGRDDQLNLVSMAAGALGWTYEDLLRQLVNSARTLQELRDLRPKALE